MARARVDPSIQRVTMDQFDFPLGCYPVEPIHPREGFTLHFEPADGGAGDDPTSEPADLEPTTPDRADSGEEDPVGDEEGQRRPGIPRRGVEGEDSGDWEEWPDRYVFDVLIRASRLDAFLRALFSLMPGRVFPILDVLGNDAFREIDPYVAYELVGIERFLDATRRFRGYLFEDGFVGFGVMSEDPFFYVFVDEHKMVTIRAEASMKDRIEQVLAGFNLRQVDELAGADSAVHEHRGVLEAPPDRPDLLTAEEIVEELRDMWGLELNVDPHRNLDDQGRELGITGWRCVVRRVAPDGMVKYVEVCLSAANLMEAHDLALHVVEEEAGEPDPDAPDDASGAKPAGAGAVSGKMPTPPRSGRRTSDPEESEPGKGSGESDEDHLTTLDVVVMERLAQEQLEELARELGLRNAKPHVKQSRVWAWRWG